MVNFSPILKNEVMDMVPQPEYFEDGTTVDDLVPVPCRCGCPDYHIIKLPMSCEHYVKCRGCGHGGQGGIYIYGAILEWNEEMDE